MSEPPVFSRTDAPCSTSPATNIGSWSGSTTPTAWCMSDLSGPMPSTTGSTRNPFDGDTTMDIKPIKTKADYRAALKEIEALMHAKPRTREGDRLGGLVTLVGGDEARHYPLD